MEVFRQKPWTISEKAVRSSSQRNSRSHVFHSTIPAELRGTFELVENFIFIFIHRQPDGVIRCKWFIWVHFGSCTCCTQRITSGSRKLFSNEKVLVVSTLIDTVVLCTHYPPYKTSDPDLWNCKAGNGCMALHYSVPEFDAHVFGSGSGRRQNGVVAGQILHRYPHFRAKQTWRKRKFVKSGRSSVVLCTHYPPYSSSNSGKHHCTYATGLTHSTI